MRRSRQRVQVLKNYTDPKGDVNTRISRSGSKARYKGDTRKLVCRILLFLWSFGALRTHGNLWQVRAALPSSSTFRSASFCWHLGSPADGCFYKLGVLSVGVLFGNSLKKSLEVKRRDLARHTIH